MSHNRIRVHLRPDEMEALHRIAEESGRTFNKVMREALRKLADMDEPEA
ncbi:ribbon-helix-helix protein, CopG family [Streptomyces sp. GbtcB6]|nr:ribbon-helix-helix protein, CopG family [Streptomyces sp. GbtcB6]